MFNNFEHFDHTLLTCVSILTVHGHSTEQGTAQAIHVQKSSVDTIFCGISARVIEVEEPLEISEGPCHEKLSSKSFYLCPVIRKIEGTITGDQRS